MAEGLIYLIVSILYFLVGVSVLIGIIFLIKEMNKWKRQYIEGQRNSGNYFPLVFILLVLICPIAGCLIGIIVLIIVLILIPLQPHMEGAGVAALLLGFLAGIIAALVCFILLLWQFAIRPWRIKQKTLKSEGYGYGSDRAKYLN